MWIKYRVVIFDCDDTILATAKKRWEALIETAKGFGKQLNESTIRASWGKPFNQLIAALVPDIDFTTFIEAYKTVMQSLKPEATSGAIEFIQELQRRCVRMEIVTSSSHSLIVQDLDQVGLTEYFADIYGYEETGYTKPDPRVLTPVLQMLAGSGYEPDEIIYIGDSVRDYQVAKGNNLDFFAVLTGLEGRREFQSAGLSRKRIFATLADLNQIDPK